MAEPSSGEFAADITVHVIRSSYHHRDVDNRPTVDEQIVEDEGWFADSASAAVRCEQLNANDRALHASDMDRRRRDRDAKIAAAETANREAAILRANGMPKDDIPVPKEFTPTAFEDWRHERPHTVFEVIEIRRSDHDGMARAAKPKSEDETDTVAVAVSGTA
jgi:hypothetical protein